MSELSVVDRAKLIQTIRRNQRSEGETFILDRAQIKAALESTRLSSPAEQAANAIRVLGDSILSGGSALDAIPYHFFADIGAASPERAARILQDLLNLELITGEIGIPRVLWAAEQTTIQQKEITVRGLDLTLAGWERYEDEKRGRFSGQYGFVALKFNEPALDAMLSAIKPELKTALGYDLIDMRDAARAGLIDNVMREKIRDSAFVVVDLTHDNYGAYWEAGYAEGLGKPVLYICEKSKFESASTHFDTNHMTTVLWEAEDHASFLETLVATLKRSITTA